MPFCQPCTPQNSRHVLSLLNEQGTQLCSLHSLTHKRRPISAMFSSNKISQHNYNIPHKPSIAHALQFLHTVKTDHISTNAQYSNYIAATHNITHSPCTSKCTTHLPLHTYHYTPTTTPPQCLPQPFFAYN